MDKLFKKNVENVRMDKILHSNEHSMITGKNTGFNFILVNSICNYLI